MTSARPCYLLACCLIIISLMLNACSAKNAKPQPGQIAQFSATITEIDEHGNAVTDILSDTFTEHGWQIGDTLEATFETGETILIKFVQNYSDVPVGDYLGRFSTSSGRFKIAINRGNIAETLKLKNHSPVTIQKVEPLATN